MKQYIADAFTDKLFSGNPAAVLPCKQFPSAEMMQKIAIENNYSETAFVVKTAAGQYDLRWFTPGGEIDLCGHATLATAFILSEFVDRGVSQMHFHTLSGELVVQKTDDGYTMDFPLGKIKPITVTDEIRVATNNLAKAAWFDGGDLVVLAPDEKSVADFEPDGERIAKLDGLGLILTAPADSEEYDFVSRCFYPKLNVLEDPVTGRAHTFLAPVWAEKLGKKKFKARQLSNRGGSLYVELCGNRVILGGKVQLFMQGDIQFDF